MKYAYQRIIALSAMAIVFSVPAFAQLPQVRVTPQNSAH